MRVVPWLSCLVTIVTRVWTVDANVEKTIFLGPRPIELPNDHVGLHHLRLDALSAAHASVAPVISTQLPVQFPSSPAPRGLESWYFLRDLEEGRRYEVRVCWPATSPTDFWLDTFTEAQVFATPELLSSLSRYGEQLQRPRPAKDESTSVELPARSSTLLLRIQAAASFYSTNRTLMEQPPTVDVDIILDPFIFNILPCSLAPTAAYISIVAVGAWFLSGFIYRWIRSVAVEPLPKTHHD